MNIETGQFGPQDNVQLSLNRKLFKILSSWIKVCLCVLMTNPSASKFSKPKIAVVVSDI